MGPASCFPGAVPHTGLPSGRWLADGQAQAHAHAAAQAAVHAQAQAHAQAAGRAAMMAQQHAHAQRADVRALGPSTSAPLFGGAMCLGVAHAGQVAQQVAAQATQPRVNLLAPMASIGAHGAAAVHHAIAYNPHAHAPFRAMPLSSASMSAVMGDPPPPDGHVAAFGEPFGTPPPVELADTQNMSFPLDMLSGVVARPSTNSLSGSHPKSDFENLLDCNDLSLSEGSGGQLSMVL